MNFNRVVHYPVVSFFHLIFLKKQVHLEVDAWEGHQSIFCDLGMYGGSTSELLCRRRGGEIGVSVFVKMFTKGGVGWIDRVWRDY